MEEIKQAIDYAIRGRDEAIANDDNDAILYWRGYIDALQYAYRKLAEGER